MKYSDLTGVFAELKAAAPVFKATEKRKQALLQLDKIFGEADSEISHVLGKFYRARVDAALAEIRAYNGKTPRLWKFYSSGVIIKSADLTITIDLNDGCVPVQGRTRILLRDDQIRQIADLTDEYYCTHSHEDHISTALCDALAYRKKLIVMPSECIRRWIIKGATASEKLSSGHTRTFLDCQAGTLGGDLDCSLYLFTLTNGRQVVVRGDIFHKEGFDACMAQLRAWGAKVNYALMTPYFTSGDDPVERLSKEYNCRFIPIHEWEFGHRTHGVSGPATQCYDELFRTFDRLYQNGFAQILSWGESIDLD